MGLNNPAWGEGYVPAYQMSAMPYVTSSNVSLGAIKEINFNYVTKFFTIKNNGAAANVISVGFTQNGMTPANSNYFVVSGSESFTFDVRTSRIVISGSAGSSTTFSLLAGLTNIPVSNFLVVTGSSGFSGVG